MDTLLQNLRYGLRQLRRNPGFSLVGAAIIALGIGATTVIFSVVYAVLLKPLPVDAPDRLVEVMEIRGDLPVGSVSYPHFQAYREGTGGLIGMGAFDSGEIDFHGGEQAETLLGTYVTSDHFDLLGLVPSGGRFFSPDEEQTGVPVPVAVISHALWQGRLGGEPDVVGRTVRLNSRPLTIIGVAPEGFTGLVTGLRTDVWVPIPMYAELNPGSDIYRPDRHSWLVMFGRLAPGTSTAAVQARLGATARELSERSDRELGLTGVTVARYSGIPGPEATSIRLFLGLLLGTAGLVLLIACVNVAGMLLARATTRRREVGIRLALGAGRRRLVGQLLTESTLLFLAGGLGGILLALWLADLVTQFPAALPVEIALDVSPDLRVLAFGIVLSLATGLLFGLLPALQASRPGVVPALKDGGGVTWSRSRLRSAFVVGQISVSLLLLITAGLLVRSFQSSLAVDPGMDPEGVVVASLNIAPHGYDQEEGLRFYEQYADRLRALPGVQSVSLAGMVPLGFDQNVLRVQIPGHQPPGDRDYYVVDFNVVGPEYFSTLRIALQGREFSWVDGPDTPGVVIINRTMADRFWPGGDALDAFITISGQERRIVGIAAEGRYGSLHEEPIPFVFLPFGQEYAPGMTLHVRSSEAMGPVASMMRNELRAMDANVPLRSPAALADRIRISLLPQRMGATLIGIFGLLGLLLAAVGLYGVLAYTVSQRTRELGVRIALGAGSGDILRLVLRQGALLLVLGLACGLVLSLAATRALGGLLAGVSATDPTTFLGVSFFLGATALLASYLPARRATKVDPMVALRSE
jgi:predicted permease